MSDGVIHLALNHDFSKYMDNCQADRRAIEAVGSVLAGSERPLVVTSGTAMALTPGRVGDRRRSAHSELDEPPQRIGRSYNQDGVTGRARVGDAPAPSPQPGQARPHYLLDRDSSREGGLGVTDLRADVVSSEGDDSRACRASHLSSRTPLQRQGVSSA